MGFGDHDYPALDLSGMLRLDVLPRPRLAVDSEESADDPPTPSGDDGKEEP